MKSHCKGLLLYHFWSLSKWYVRLYSCHIFITTLGVIIQGLPIWSWYRNPILKGKSYQVCACLHTTHNGMSEKLFLHAITCFYLLIIFLLTCISDFHYENCQKWWIEINTYGKKYCNSGLFCLLLRNIALYVWKCWRTLHKTLVVVVAAEE